MGLYAQYVCATLKQLRRYPLELRLGTGFADPVLEFRSQLSGDDGKWEVQDRAMTRFPGRFPR
ncbi:hypothetical protein sS8_4200 [Methylocaldum marinum]|uniref:Uncharacterized protein n=1 Tax=Methylocaldum marinum TaxID=1432792 RepID=A0A250KWV3_9GAMM|nr:hypothetical protein sS8_4200 [Methylocaldum marinum]